MKKSSKVKVLVHNKSWMLTYKPPTFPCQEDKTKDPDLLKLVEEIAGKNLHLVNRLDRPASGLVLMAKKGKATKYYQFIHRLRDIEKRYIIITEKADIPKSGTLENILSHNKKINKAFVEKTKKENGKKSILSYEIIKELDNYYVMDVKLETGRFHQIRCQIAHLGCPIKGDVKYGARRSNKDRSIFLHAYEMTFVPYKDKEKSTYYHRPPSNRLWDIAWETIKKVRRDREK